MSVVTSANAVPEGAKARTVLAEKVRARRLGLGLSVRAAAEQAGMARTTWIGLEEATRRTSETNHVGIERTLEWQPGSVRAILDGGEPATLDSSSRSMSSGIGSAARHHPGDEALIRIMRSDQLTDDQKASIVRQIIAEQDQFARARADELIHDALHGGR